MPLNNLSSLLLPSTILLFLYSNAFHFSRQSILHFLKIIITLLSFHLLIILCWFFVWSIIYPINTDIFTAEQLDEILRVENFLFFRLGERGSLFVFVKGELKFERRALFCWEWVFMRDGIFGNWVWFDFRRGPLFMYKLPISTNLNPKQLNPTHPLKGISSQHFLN